MCKRMCVDICIAAIYMFDVNFMIIYCIPFFDAVTLFTTPSGLMTYLFKVTELKHNKEKNNLTIN